MGCNSTQKQTLSLLPLLRGKEVFVGKDGDDDNDGMDDSPLRTLIAAFTKMNDEEMSFGTIVVIELAVIGKIIHLEEEWELFVTFLDTKHCLCVIFVGSGINCLSCTQHIDVQLATNPTGSTNSTEVGDRRERWEKA
ncbi:hypothetical protein BLNAU_7430 [Blattamonas nauphoetae]|uniref:Uncharacterized protein n=1 Tax=Blattamonas nauphoetae TaxID=2049346 RepID=A0ABQ9Y1B3_9EUKA|nr:hypothetical protein BLNAU_7430 [Blattamonas nauphoetae]